MKVNGITGAAATKIYESFLDYFEGIESTFDMMENGDFMIKATFLSKMRNYYLDYLVQENIEVSDCEKKSYRCMEWVFERAKGDLGKNPKIDCFQEQVDDYLYALIVYAFYRRRILIPVEGEK